LSRGLQFGPFCRQAGNPATPRACPPPGTHRKRWDYEVHLLEAMIDIEFLRFLLVGLVNTVVGLGTIYACKWFLGFGDVLSNIIGYAFGLTVSFTLNSRWTFHFRGNQFWAMLKFAAVFCIAYLTNLSTVILLIEKFQLNSYLAQALGLPPYTLLFYLGSRLFAFR